MKLKDAYYLNPKLCLECSSIIEYRRRKTNKFCSHKCACIYHNKIHQNKYNTSYCLECNSSLPYMQRRNKFCNHSCCASFNNKHKEKILKNCLNCSKGVYSKSDAKYCSKACEKEHKYKTHIHEWQLNPQLGCGNDFHLTTRIRRYIFDKYNHQCARCSWKEINPYSGRSPLHIDHIDGNASNAKEENLILLCPNCHSLTSTWGTLNMGSGRKSLKKN